MEKIIELKNLHEDFMLEVLEQFIDCAMDEFDPDIDKGLLSGRDLIDMNGEWEDECVILDNFLFSQMVSFN